jgi:hypothetical protein
MKAIIYTELELIVRLGTYLRPRFSSFSPGTKV